MAPKRSHGSQGTVERFIQTVQCQLRTLISDIEHRADIKVLVSSPIFAWMLRHSCFLLNRYTLNKHGETPYRSVTGANYLSPLCAFGETVQFLVPSERHVSSSNYRAPKLAPRFSHGLWLGRSSADNTHLVLTLVPSSSSLTFKGVVNVRTVRRCIAEERWAIAKPAISAMLATPLHPSHCPSSYGVSTRPALGVVGSQSQSPNVVLVPSEPSNTSSTSNVPDVGVPDVPGFASSSTGGRRPRYSPSQKTDDCSGCHLGSGYRHSVACNNRFNSMKPAASTGDVNSDDVTTTTKPSDDADPPRGVSTGDDSAVGSKGSSSSSSSNVVIPSSSPSQDVAVAVPVSRPSQGSTLALPGHGIDKRGADAMIDDDATLEPRSKLAKVVKFRVDTKRPAADLFVPPSKRNAITPDVNRPILSSSLPSSSTVQTSLPSTDSSLPSQAAALNLIRAIADETAACDEDETRMNGTVLP